MEIKLEESHRRVVGSGLLIVDSAAIRVLDLIDGRNSPAAIKAFEGCVSEEEKRLIRNSLLHLQELIRAFIRKYKIEPSKKNLRRIVASEVSQMWLCLEDSRPDRIQGYGTITAPTSQALESDLQQMLSIVNGIRALLSS
jgi:hypothetical protein